MVFRYYETLQRSRHRRELRFQIFFHGSPPGSFHVLSTQKKHSSGAFILVLRGNTATCSSLQCSSLVRGSFLHLFLHFRASRCCLFGCCFSWHQELFHSRTLWQHLHHIFSFSNASLMYSVVLWSSE